MLTRKYESEHAKSKNTIRGGQTTARYLCVKKAPFSHVVTVIRPRVSLSSMKKKIVLFAGYCSYSSDLLYLSCAFLSGIDPELSPEKKNVCVFFKPNII